ncbi:MAG TPA: CDP-alcohol phosphatidyltransferase family protein [Candidatus Limnocylindrales bacterium]|nr:CDP-alcohol phosphatidyltransferase family protein [Candidatus Limnocylindrales bacterium]
MIKTTSLALLALRYMRSNRRASAAATFGQMLVRSRLLARRARSKWNHWKLRLPVLLVSFRAALGPVTILCGLLSRRGFLLTACIGLALLSDVLDGALARRWHRDTENLRRWDTRADTFFYACVLLLILLRHPSALERRWVLIAGLITAEALQHVFAAAKYGRHASYHSILSKIWGLMMAAAMAALLGFGSDNWFLDLTIAWGILCNLQGLAMSLLLPTWHRDVPTLFHALRLRAARNGE